MDIKLVNTFWFDETFFTAGSHTQELLSLLNDGHNISESNANLTNFELLEFSKILKNNIINDKRTIEEIAYFSYFDDFWDKIDSDLNLFFEGKRDYYDLHFFNYYLGYSSLLKENGIKQSLGIIDVFNKLVFVNKTVATRYLKTMIFFRRFAEIEDHYYYHYFKANFDGDFNKYIDWVGYSVHKNFFDKKEDRVFFDKVLLDFKAYISKMEKR